MKKVIYLILGSVFVLTSCNLQDQKKNKITQEFYEIYSERKDIDKLMAYYSANSELVDVVPNVLTEGKENIKQQYIWNDPLYKKHPDYPKTLIIKEILVKDNVVAINGEYTPYYYNGKLINAMKFNTWLYFDEEGKIKKQVEWVQYPMDVLEEIITIKKSLKIN